MFRGHSKSTFAEEGRGGASLKSEQKRTGRGGGCPSMWVRSLLKKMLRFSKRSFIVILQFFLLIIMAVWNIKQSIMKDDILSPVIEWRVIVFASPFYFAQLFVLFSALSIIFLRIFSKNVYLFIGYRCTSWSVVKCTNIVNLVWRH